MCRVPFGFKWPSYNTSTIWTLRHFGDLHRSIGPYKFISREHDLTLALCKVNYSRAKSIMKALTNFAIRDGRVRSAANIKQQNHQEIYDYVMPLLMQVWLSSTYSMLFMYLSYSWSTFLSPPGVWCQGHTFCDSRHFTPDHVTLVALASVALIYKLTISKFHTNGRSLG